MTSETRPEDIWAAWLRRRRTGGAEMDARMVTGLEATRDRVLDNARLAEGDTLLDVGAGQGLIAFGALERGAGRVVFSDISQDLLDEAQETAQELGLADRCEFVNAPADDLPLDDESVDVVTTRSVLIFVKEKAKALREFHRVLRPGGRVSLFEPINIYFSSDGPSWPWDMSAHDDLRAKVDALYDRYQPADDPMLDFDERDLLRLVLDAGFGEVRMELKVEIVPVDPVPWDAFANSSGNPKIPTWAEAVEEALTPEERERLEAHLRPLVEQGIGTSRRALAFVWAIKS